MNKTNEYLTFIVLCGGWMNSAYYQFTIADEPMLGICSLIIIMNELIVFALKEYRNK